ncbi:MAG TPA: DegT/DnrJ/EryC1/StrS family aminotransferase [Kofleriaceae bacterium]|nr:DegT/DnrJ/EryC1/StrS family aminotransferase [Kofleriaceae bacterium]
MFELSIAPKPSRGSVPVGSVFGEQQIAGFSRGREALSALLVHLELAGDEAVAVLTTSGSRYISGCVTETIERHGRWTRELESGVRIALVIHEWGFPLAGMAALAEQCADRGIVLIEDCAYALGTYLSGREVGRYGDYALFSLPKFFAIEAGGVLVSARGERLPVGTNELASLVESPAEIIGRRREVWQHYLDVFGSAAYPAAEPGVPGVFLLRCAERYRDLKPYLQGQGIEAGFWYGNDYLFLPCHQQMTVADVRQIRDLIAVRVGHVELY